MTAPDLPIIAPTAIVTNAYSVTHQVINQYETITWPTGDLPVNGLPFTAGNATIATALAYDLYFAMYSRDGSTPGSQFASWHLPAGSTSVAVSSAAAAFSSGTTKFYFQTWPAASWTAPLPNVTLGVTLTWTSATPPPACQYGAEPNPSAGNYAFVTAALLELIVSALDWPAAVVVAFNAFLGVSLIYPLCNSVPPLPPALTAGDYIGGTLLPNPLSADKWLENLAYGLWLVYCQCKPDPAGQNPPRQPDKPPPPPGVSDNPIGPQPCSNSDICTELVRIENILTNMKLTQSNSFYVQSEPSYTYGAQHTGLSGNGEIAVTSIMGVFVQFTALPARVGGLIGDPNTLYDVGHITFGTPDGWFPPSRLTSNPWISLPLHTTNVTRIGYSIPSDVTLTLRELVPAKLVLTPVPGT